MPTQGPVPSLRSATLVPQTLIGNIFREIFQQSDRAEVGANGRFPEFQSALFCQNVGTLVCRLRKNGKVLKYRPLFGVHRLCAGEDDLAALEHITTDRTSAAASGPRPSFMTVTRHLAHASATNPVLVSAGDNGQPLETVLHLTSMRNRAIA